MFHSLKLHKHVKLEEKEKKSHSTFSFLIVIFSSQFKYFLNTFFLILTQFNTHYEFMQNSIYCSERCASVALFSYLLSLFSAFYTVTVFNARTL